MGKLTDYKVKHANSEHKDTFLQDGDGLALRVLGTGAKSWVFRYRRPSDKKQDKFTFGKYPALSLKEARELVSKYKEQLDAGIDPKYARAAEYDTNAQALTVGGVFALWIAHLEKTGGKSEKTVKQHRARWENHLKTPLQNIFAKDITRAHLSAALEAMRHKGIVEETRKALTTINLLLDYAASRHLITENPARLLKPKDFAATSSEPRERHLTLGELRQLWVVLEDALKSSSGRISPVSVAAFKLLVLTGARRSEVVKIKWADIDMKMGAWVIPTPKNKKAHTVYLSPFSLKLIKSLKPLSGHSQFVFQTLAGGKGHITADSLTKGLARLQGMDKEKAKTDKDYPLAHLDPFTVHDIRRSASTAWGEHLKIAPHIIEKMLNHQPKDKLVATYQKAEYWEEQKAAWQAWSDKVEAVIANDPKNVRHISEKKKA